MTLTHLLDTSVYSQRLRAKPVRRVVESWQELGDRRLAISAICEAELLFGLEKRKSERLWQEYQSGLKDRLQCLYVDSSVAAIYGILRADMESKGTPRADFDLLIAATAIHHKLTLATLNPKHFDKIPGLTVENWA